MDKHWQSMELVRMLCSATSARSKHCKRYCFFIGKFYWGDAWYNITVNNDTDILMILIIMHLKFHLELILEQKILTQLKTLKKILRFLCFCKKSLSSRPSTKNIKRYKDYRNTK